MDNFNERTNFIWNIANLIRDSFKRGKYQDVILPFTVLRRVDAVLAPTKQDVLAEDARLDEYGIENKHDRLCTVAGYAFYNTSRPAGPHPAATRAARLPEAGPEPQARPREEAGRRSSRGSGSSKPSSTCCTTSRRPSTPTSASSARC